jgi:hypothetical protein
LSGNPTYRALISIQRRIHSMSPARSAGERFQIPLAVYPLLALASAGLVASLILHLAALLGNASPFSRFGSSMCWVLVVVWFPSIFVMNRLTRDFKQKDIWKAALRGCPKVVQWALWIVVGYSWLGVFGLPFLFGGGRDSPANSARSVSGLLLPFYAIAACVLYSATRAEKLDQSARCLNGHHISPLAKYCEECGAPARNPSLH